MQFSYSWTPTGLTLHKSWALTECQLTKKGGHDMANFTQANICCRNANLHGKRIFLLKFPRQNDAVDRRRNNKVLKYLRQK